MSELKNTTIHKDNSLTLNDSSKSCLHLPTASGGNEYGYADGKVLKSNGETVYWDDYLSGELTGELSDYFIPPADAYTEDLTTIDGTEYNLTKGFSNGVVYPWLASDETPETASGKFLYALPWTTEQPNIAVTIPPTGSFVGAVSLVATHYMMINGTSIVSYANSGTKKAYVILSEETTAEAAFNSYIYRTEIEYPMYVSGGSNTMTVATVNYTNNTFETVNAYIYVCVGSSNESIRNMKTSSSGSAIMSGAFIIPAKCRLNGGSYVNFSGHNGLCPMGVPYYKYFKNGYVIINNNDSFTLRLPNAFAIRRGGMYFEISRNGIFKSADGGKTKVALSTNASE